MEIAIKKITKNGVTFEITDTCYGMLVQGGIRGKKVFFKWSSLRKYNIDENLERQELESSLEVCINDYGTTVEQLLMRDIEGDVYDRLISKGWVIT